MDKVLCKSPGDVFMDFQRSFPIGTDFTFSQGNFLRSRMLVRDDDGKYIDIVIYYESNVGLFLFVKGYVNHDLCPSILVTKEVSRIMNSDPKRRIILSEEEIEEFGQLDWSDNIEISMKILAWYHSIYSEAGKRTMGSSLLRKRVSHIFNKRDLIG